MATVRRIRGKWWVDYRDPLGRRRREVAGDGSTKRYAELLLRERMGQIDAGSFHPDGHSKRFGVYALEWLKAIRPTLKRATWDTYRGHLRNHLLDPALGLEQRRLRAISRPIVMQFRAALVATRPGLSNHTYNRIMSRLSQVLESARMDGLIAANPVHRVGQLPVEEQEMAFLNPGELYAVLEAARGISEDLRVGILLSAMTGIRLGELRALRRQHLDLAAGRLLVRQSYGRGQFTSPKNRHHRDVKLSPHLVGELRAWVLLKGNPAGDAMLFPGPKGRPAARRTLFWDAWKRALRAAGVNQALRWHDLRHTYASLLLAQGASMKFVSQQLGHSSIQITLDRYTHLLPDAGERDLELLDEMVFGRAAGGKYEAGS